ncbi:MAG TPA: galactose-1-phosphate uridylyltransferase [Anaerolineae bacterium]|nr:galactose-1-phosphate uridylyltransferase [Anaerolineae bacterium]
MSEIRQNLVTKEWVIIATERAHRPEEFVHATRPLTETRPVWEPGCPFCPGNEEGTPAELLRLPPTGPWQIRVVLNKYPALKYDAELIRHSDGIYRSITGAGHHEIIIESPRHNTTIALQAPAETTLALHASRSRGRFFAKDPRVEQIIFFKNHGPRAGTSLVHPHAQVIALPIVPHSLRTRAEEARRYFDDTGECALCRMYQDELHDKVRLVAENQGFVAFILYAAFSPFPLWIVPRRHEPSFLNATDQELEDLADIMYTVLRKLYIGLKDPDYNYVIRSAPLHDPGLGYLHWYVSIIPRVSRSAGFELGSGMFINTSLPEESAAFLRSVQVE